MAEPIHRYTVSEHAKVQMRYRGLSISVVHQVISTPEQRFQHRAGRDVLQSRVQLGETLYLVRVFVDVQEQPPEIVTVYCTSKVSKYWRTEG